MPSKWKGREELETHREKELKRATSEPGEQRGEKVTAVTVDASGRSAI